MDTVVITPAGLLELLTQVEELKDYNIGVVESLDGQLQLQIGESVYALGDHSAPEVSVAPEVVEQVEDINLEAYQNIEEDIDITDNAQSVEGGLITNIIKAVKVGGMLRLAARVLKNNLLS